MTRLNSAAMASVMPCVGLTSKNRPGVAHCCILVEISDWKGLIQLLYQLLVGKGR